MTKLLIVNQKDEQELLVIDTGGGYFDLTKVLWDERLDGPFPQELLYKIGGLVRVDDKLEVDQKLLSSSRTSKILLAESKKKKEQQIKDALELIEGIHEDTVMTATDVKNVVKALVILAKK